MHFNKLCLADYRSAMHSSSALGYSLASGFPEMLGELVLLSKHEHNKTLTIVLHLHTTLT